MPRPKTVPIALDERERFMRWDMNAVALVEETTGADALRGIPVTAKNLRAMIYAGLAAHEMAAGRELDLTLQQVGSLLTPEAVKEASAALALLLKANTPQPVEGSQEPDPPRAPAAEPDSPSSEPTRSVASISD